MVTSHLPGILAWSSPVFTEPPMPRYVFELKGTNDGETTAYHLIFPDLPPAWREAQTAALDWVAVR